VGAKGPEHDGDERRNRAESNKQAGHRRGGCCHRLCHSKRRGVTKRFRINVAVST
jgi:hypothetical protein